MYLGNVTLKQFLTGRSVWARQNVCDAIIDGREHTPTDPTVQ